MKERENDKTTTMFFTNIVLFQDSSLNSIYQQNKSEHQHEELTENIQIIKAHIITQAVKESVI